jgi:hypothetical protein
MSDGVVLVVSVNHQALMGALYADSSSKSKRASVLWPGRVYTIYFSRSIAFGM